MSVAVIGPSSFITCFQLIGAEGYNCTTAEATAEIIKRLIDEKRYKLIIFPERFAKETLPVREQVLKRGAISPVFALVPDFTMETGDRMQELQAVISLAIGTKLEL
jgi:vacuolar-type H+-ATPase subunit F/Vma7